MRFPNPFTSRKSSRNRASKHETRPLTRLSRFERLETRDLLSLSTSSADYQALVAASSFETSADASAIWVTSLDDVVNASDGKITLREAIDYAGQELRGNVVSSTIRFAVGGSITLSTSYQSLKIAGKSVAIDGSDVGGVTIKAQNSLVFYAYGGTALVPVNLSLSNLTLSGGKTASTRGAGVQLAPYCNLSTTRCTISGNTSTTASGAGVYAESGSLRFVDTVFSYNGCSGTNAGKGGAVFLNSGSLSAINTTFLSNYSGEGGAVYVKSGSSTFSNCLFDANTASSGNGGAITTNVPVTLDNVGFRNNQSSENGGALYVYGNGNSVLSDVSFFNNSAIRGGAIYQNGQEISIASSYFLSNAANEAGGAIYIANASSVHLESSSVSSNVAQDGGALFNAGSLTISDAEIEGNVASNNGGALNSTKGYFEIRNVNFLGNSADNQGGAIFLQGGLLSWLLSSKIVNSSAYEGAGIVNIGNLNVADAQIIGNISNGNGGGFVNQSTAFITRSDLSDNVALGTNGAGGAVLNYVDAALTIVDSTLRNNVSTFGEGGAIANNGSVALYGSSVVCNKAGTFGGGVSNLATFTSQYSAFLQNQASNGGAISDAFNSESSFVYTSLCENVASNLGGALYSYGKPVFQNCTIKHNVASSSDVAAYYSSDAASSTPTFSSTVVESNYASEEAPNLATNEEIVIVDDLNRPLNNGNVLYLDDFAVNSGSISKTLTIANYGASKVRLSKFVDKSSIPSGVFSYSLTSDIGDEIDPAGVFTLDPGESIHLTITINPKSLGSHTINWSWQTDALTSSGPVVNNSNRSLTFNAAINVVRAASVNSSVDMIEDGSEYNVSVNHDGSFSISLTKAPSSERILFLKTSTDAAILSTDVVLFDPNNYQTPQTVHVSIDQDKLLKTGKLDSIVISPQVLGNDANFNGTAIDDIVLNVAEYVVLQNGASIDVNELVPAGTTRWDFNGDGNVDVLTYGSPYWVDSSQIEGDTISYMRTRNGVATTTSIDVAAVDVIPQAQAEISVFDSTPGLIRLALDSQSGPIKRWRINWGDGSPYTECLGLSNSTFAAHAYTQDGQYAVSVELVDADGRGEGEWTLIALQEISGVDAISSAILDVNAEKADEFTQADCHFVACAIIAEQEKLRKKRMGLFL